MKRFHRYARSASDNSDEQPMAAEANIRATTAITAFDRFKFPLNRRSQKFIHSTFNLPCSTGCHPSFRLRALLSTTWAGMAYRSVFGWPTPVICSARLRSFIATLKPVVVEQIHNPLFIKVMVTLSYPCRSFPLFNIVTSIVTDVFALCSGRRFI